MTIKLDCKEGTKFKDKVVFPFLFAVICLFALSLDLKKLFFVNRERGQGHIFGSFPHGWLRISSHKDFSVDPARSVLLLPRRRKRGKIHSDSEPMRCSARKIGRHQGESACLSTFSAVYQTFFPWLRFHWGRYDYGRRFRWLRWAPGAVRGVDGGVKSGPIMRLDWFVSG